jgi:hypothetical protein
VRRHLSIALACGLAAGSVSAHAGDKPFVVGDHADQLAVYRDELGSFYVVPVATAPKDIAEWVFFGDAKKLYQQRIKSSYTSSNGGFDWYVWAPRAKGLPFGLLERMGDKLSLTCHAKDAHELVQLGADEAKAFLARATLLPPLWRHQAHLLARDDDGVYYYVDSSIDDAYTDLRVFIGLKGAMKELALTNVVHDSAGELYVSKSGTLKVLAGNRNAVWTKDGKKSELTVVDLQRDQYLVYRELGIYGQLGAVCEDQ